MKMLTEKYNSIYCTWLNISNIGPNAGLGSLWWRPDSGIAVRIQKANLIATVLLNYLLTYHRQWYTALGTPLLT